MTRTRGLLLITLDAFGTLYRPRKSIPLQYLEVARSCGLKLEASAAAAAAAAMAQSFKAAFQTHSSRSPNYGRASTGGTSTTTTTTTTPTPTPERWWADVVHDTFKPLLSLFSPPASPQLQQHIPDRLAGELFRHFSTGKAYELFPDTMPFIRQMRRLRLRHRHRHPGSPLPSSLLSSSLPGVQDVVVGVLTNSDPRVAGILQSLGLELGSPNGGPGQPDLDFVLTSYEIGHEKPSPMAFAEAEQRARAALGLPRLQLGDQQSYHDQTGAELHTVKVHVGDDLHKDYWGPIRSGRGWDAVLLARNTVETGSPSPSPSPDVRRITKLTDIEAVLMSLLERSAE